MHTTPNHRWTSRWTSLRPHHEQLRLWQSKARFKIIPAGRRSGKTELAKRRLVHSLFIKNKYKVPPRFFAAAPTRDQAKRIWWQDLCDLIKPDWIKSINASELKIKLKNGAELIVLGMERPQRMEGVSWDGGVIDEYADCKKGTFDAHIRPSLADREGWLWLIGVPDVEGPAQVEYEQFYDLASKGTDEEWAAFHWASADILRPEEIASAKRRMDPRLFEQEMMGKFILAGGRAFPDFSQDLHVKSVDYDPKLPICWSLDFNINPMCSGVLQHHDGKIVVLEELVLPDTKTDVAVTAFLDRAAERGWNLEKMQIYGDSTGNCRDSTSGLSDWIIVKNRLAHLSPKFCVPRANPAIKETINAINAKLKSADETVSLQVNPKCHQLINDFRNALWPSPNLLHDEHSLAWLRYFVQREYPIRLDRKKAKGTIGFSSG
jgi:Terminase large subunit, T4likevirus-type, N-terminal